MKLLFLLSLLLCALMAYAADYACPACPANYLPVCGTNGKTYPNECSLVCTAGPGVKVARSGSC